MRHLLLLVLGCALPSLSWSFATVVQDFSYSIGVNFGRSLNAEQKANFSPDAFVQGLTDAEQNRKLRYSDTDTAAYVQKHRAATDPMAHKLLINANKEMLSYNQGAGVGRAMLASGKTLLDPSYVGLGLKHSLGGATPQLPDSYMQKLHGEYANSIGANTPPTAK